MVFISFPLGQIAFYGTALVTPIIIIYIYGAPRRIDMGTGLSA